MRRKTCATAICIVIVLFGFNAANHFTRAQQNENATDVKQNQSSAQPADAERGRYIVHHVAMCIYCHTPRDERGVLDEHRFLHGAPMPVKSPFRGQTWAFMAPKIAGLPGGWSEDEMVRFLQAGQAPTGHKPRPPMPPFRFNKEDARAVAAYLKSLQ